MRLILCTLAALSGLFLAGCTGGLSQLPPNDSAYFGRKTKAALGTTNCMKEQLLLTQNGKRFAIIALLTSQQDAEDRCLKVLRAMSRDPMVPSVDEINVKAECDNGTRQIQQNFGGPVPITNRRGVTTMADIYVPVTVGSERVFRTVYSCVITRDALMKGGNPTVVIRNGVFVSGPNKGEVAP